MDLIADTTLLVGIWRSQPWARSFVTANTTKSLGIPWIVFGEFWHGALRANHDKNQVRRFLSIRLPLIDPEPVIPIYTKLCASLQDLNIHHPIGQNDLWIAATCLSQGKPLVTRNVRHFDKIDGLQLEIPEK